MHALDDVSEDALAAGAAPPQRWVYTDGSHKQGGNRSQRKKGADGPAGWAAVTIANDHVSGSKRVVHARSGRVVIMPGEPGYRGATRHSNNTGELTALLEAILDERARPAGTVAFCVDSTYAINVATGKWRARPANGELTRRLRAAARALILERGAPSVRFQHVRAHIGVPGNETADALAKAAVEQAWMCGTAPAVLLYARDAYARAVSDGAGAGSGRPSNQTGDQTCFRQQGVQPEARMVGVQLGVG